MAGHGMPAGRGNGSGVRSSLPNDRRRDRTPVALHGRPPGPGRVVECATQPHGHRVQLSCRSRPAGRPVFIIGRSDDEHPSDRDRPRPRP
eukprot:750888-Hanusia_phi.AAC.1